MVAPGKWVISGLCRLECDVEPATVSPNTDGLVISYSPDAEDIFAARIASQLNKLGLAFSAGKDWSPADYITFLKEKGLLREEFKEIYWTAPGRWHIRPI